MKEKEITKFEIILGLAALVVVALVVMPPLHGGMHGNAHNARAPQSRALLQSHMGRQGLRDEMSPGSPAPGMETVSIGDESGARTRQRASRVPISSPVRSSDRRVPATSRARWSCTPTG